MNNPQQTPPKHQHPFWVRLRNYFFTGVALIAPISVTFYVVWGIISFIDAKIKPLIPEIYYPEHYLPFNVPGIGLLAVVVGLTLVGAIGAGIFGRYFTKLSERLVDKMPIVRSIYKAIKQIFETVFSNNSSTFRKVVLVEYPRKGIWSMGFLTGITKGEVQELTQDDVLNVFIPTTPNPTSGYLLFVPKQDIVPLSMTVEEGIKMVISGGIITPHTHGQPNEESQGN